MLFESISLAIFCFDLFQSFPSLIFAGLLATLLHLHQVFHIPYPIRITSHISFFKEKLTLVPKTSIDKQHRLQVILQVILHSREYVGLLKHSNSILTELFRKIFKLFPYSLCSVLIFIRFSKI